MGKVPSYSGYQPVSAAASRIKRKNRSRDTQHEVLLRRELWRRGLRFRKNLRSLPGKPDIVFLGPRVAVFCDGDFWHGRNWPALKEKLEHGSNAGYWPAKIASNVERDRQNTSLLEKDGWCVVRIWETDIKRDLAAAANGVEEAVRARRQEREHNTALQRSAGINEVR